MNFFAVLNHWLHLTSVVVWIGGLAFQVFISGPLIKDGNPSRDYLQKISIRFRRLVGPLLVILVITGGVNLGIRRAGYEAVPPGYISALGVKVFLVAAIASIYLFELMRRGPEEEEEPRPESGESALPGYTFTKVTLIVGLIIIFLASMLRQWKF